MSYDSRNDFLEQMVTAGGRPQWYEWLATPLGAVLHPCTHGSHGLGLGTAGEPAGMGALPLRRVLTGMG